MNERVSELMNIGSLPPNLWTLPRFLLLVGTRSRPNPSPWLNCFQALYTVRGDLVLVFPSWTSSSPTPTPAASTPRIEAPQGEVLAPCGPAPGTQ